MAIGVGGESRLGLGGREARMGREVSMDVTLRRPRPVSLACALRSMLSSQEEELGEGVRVMSVIHHWGKMRIVPIRTRNWKG